MRNLTVACLFVGSLAVLPTFGSVSARIEAQVMPDSQRLRRLTMLGDVWGKLYLSHPNVVASDVDWNAVLIAAIPQVERAQNVHELVRVLNETLFRPLGDPLVRARVVEADEIQAAERPIASERLDSAIVYLDATNWRLYSQRDFAARIKRQIDSIGSANALVVDLRWGGTVDPEYEGVPEWFGLWAKAPLEVGPLASRVHRGWFETSAGEGWGQTWQIGRTVHLPTLQGAPYANVTTVFLVNNASVKPLAPALDALQSLPRTMVVWEQRGAFADETVMSYPEGIEVRLATSMVLSRRGQLGFTPDEASATSLSKLELREIARRAVSRSPRRDPDAIAWDFGMRLPLREPVSTAPLNREQRLLGLMKLWTVLGNFFPHFEFASIDWPNLLHDWIPRVEAAETLEDYYGTIARIGAGLNDSHVSVLHPRNPWIGTPTSVFAPIDVARVQGRLIVMQDVLADSGRAAVRAGDELVAVDGVHIADIETRYRDYISSSTPGSFRVKLWTNQRALRGEPGTSTTLTIRDGAGNRDVVLRRGKRVLPRPMTDTVYQRRLPGNIGYINLITVPDSAALETALTSLGNTSGLILDLRGYSSFGMATNILRVIATSPVPAPLSEHAVVYGPGQRSWARDVSDAFVPDARRHYGKPVAVLINAAAGSQPEWIGIWLRNSGRVTFVGSHTGGFTGNGVSPVFLPGGARFMFTSVRVRHADGSRFQNIGIVPDIFIEPTIAGVRAGRDEVLQKALVYVRNSGNRR